MAYKPIKLSKSEIERIARGGKTGRSLNYAEQIAVCREYKKLGIEAKRVGREIIESSEAQQEAYREMEKAGWKADETYATPEERRAHKAEKREAGRLKAREELRQKTAIKKIIRGKIDINQYTGISSWGKKAAQNDD